MRLRTGPFFRPYPAASKAARTSCQRIGRVLNSTPKGFSASVTALAITTGGAIAPPSPSPLTPSAFSGVGVSMWTTSIGGVSAAVGSR